MGEEFDVSQASHVEIPVYSDNAPELSPLDDGAGLAGGAFDELFMDPRLFWPVPGYGDFFLPEESFGVFTDAEMYGIPWAIPHNSWDGR